jgi:hypothetical protein
VLASISDFDSKFFTFLMAANFRYFVDFSNFLIFREILANPRSKNQNLAVFLYPANLKPDLFGSPPSEFKFG